METSLETPLSHLIERISRECIECGLCEKTCKFLRENGTPRQIAERFDPHAEIAVKTTAYACNLCRLCTAVCPRGLDPAAMFLEMRREAIRNGMGPYPEHKGVLAYEHRGTSRRYSWYGLPEGCDTIFFRDAPFREPARQRFWPFTTT